MSVQAGAWALEQSKITAAEKWLLFLLGDSSDMDGYVVATLRGLSEVSRIPEPKVQAVLQSLEGKKLIEPVKPGRWRLAVPVDHGASGR